MIMPNSPIRYFLELARIKRKNPNFWMSEEYIELSGLKFFESENTIGFLDDDDFWFFPVYNSTLNAFICIGNVTGFQNEPFGKFWDHEFIYDPRNFLNLSGNKWKVFRKNVRKHQEKDWEYRKLESIEQDEVIQLFLEWVEGKEIYDPETFTKFVILGRNRFGLFLDGELKGVNIADTNYKYINYRICFDTGELYLNEFLRWKFYTSEWVLSQNKLVNDGGCLGSEGLKRFKKKLQPIEIKDIYTGVPNES